MSLPRIRTGNTALDRSRRRLLSARGSTCFAKEEFKVALPFSERITEFEGANLLTICIFSYRRDLHHGTKVLESSSSVVRLARRELPASVGGGDFGNHHSGYSRE